MHDPLNAIADLYRVIWVHDLDDQLLILDEQRIALADADLSRCDVAGMLLELSPDERRAS